MKSLVIAVVVVVLEAGFLASIAAQPTAEGALQAAAAATRPAAPVVAAR